MNPLRRLARQAPAPLDALLAMSGSGLDDVAELASGHMPGNDPDAWDPEYIRETLPTLRTLSQIYHRPEVRGVAMTPRDHPHGGGEGKSPTGMPPKTPWGKPAMGYRTRRVKTTDRLIVRSRHRKS